ncbi:MAG: lamin tail domain-containing protein [Fibrobacter sp.]|nr:lamin tail domain-containing protein [Fibrobacter sp.]
MPALKSVFATFIISLFCFCGNAPDVLNVNTGSLEFNVFFPGNNSLKKIKETSFDSLVIEIFGNDSLLLRKSSSVNPNTIVCKESINSIPAGKSRKINVYTVSKSGQIIHTDSEKTRIMDIEPNVNISLIITMIPSAGSIYLQLGAIPTSVDSVFVKFTSSDGTIWKTAVKRDPKIFISLDNIPDGTGGLIEIAEVNSSGDTIFYTSKDITIDVRNSTFLNLDMSSPPGQIEISATVIKPELTVISIGNGSLKPAETESGELLITEIMYIVNLYEYIEIFNPKNTEVTFTKLFLQIDEKTFEFSDITIKPNGYYVFGRAGGNWVNQSNSNLDLVSYGNWITLKNSDLTVIDQVIFTNNVALEWPKTTTKQAITLNKNAYSATLNNLGRNWSLVETDTSNLITDSLGLVMYGTPGW